MQFKSKIKKIAKDKKITTQIVLQNFMLERLLERLSLSNYRNNFILKGGFLISSIVGIDTRTTMDIDTTIKGLKLNSEEVKIIFNEICNIKLNDNVYFLIISVKKIREKSDYNGIRINLKACCCYYARFSHH